jgi:hypothetical protein
MAHLTLQNSSIKVGPAVVGFDSSGRVTNNVHIIAVCKDKKVLEFSLELGKGLVDAEAIKERPKAAALLTANRI